MKPFLRAIKVFVVTLLFGDDKGEDKRKFLRPKLVLILASGGLLAVILIGLISLEPCGELDKLFKRSLCLRIIEQRLMREVIFVPYRDALVTLSYKQGARVWRVSDGSLLYMLTPEKKEVPVESITVASDGSIIALNLVSQIELRKLSDGTLLDVLDLEGEVFRTTFSPDGTLFAGRLFGNNIGLWRVNDGVLLKTLKGHPESVSDIAFSPDGSVVASSALDGTIRLWKVSSGTLLQVIGGELGTLTSIAFSPDGAVLASGSSDGIIRIWQVSDGKLLKILKHPGHILSVAFSPDGHVLASGGRDSMVRLWRISDGVLLQELNQGSWRQNWVYSIAFSADGKILASAQRYGPVRLFDFQKLVETETD